jgi:hypothetical protein
MNIQILTKCPVCTENLEVKKLQCSCCGTTIENTFKLPKLLYLEKEQLHFVEVFVKCRGNIKEVEKELNISYPTVRGKLEEVILALGYENKKKKEIINKKIVLDLLESGKISPEEAIKQLNQE